MRWHWYISEKWFCLVFGSHFVHDHDQRSLLQKVLHCRVLCNRRVCHLCAVCPADINFRQGIMPELIPVVTLQARWKIVFDNLIVF